MDTPQAISAVSGELIEQLGAVDMQSLFKNIVGLNMAEGASAGTNRYLVRGIASQAGTGPTPRPSPPCPCISTTCR